MAKLRILALTYRTFPMTLAAVREATIHALKHMGLRVLPNRPDDDATSASILASGWRREVEIELEAQGRRGTRIRVLAKEGVFFEENTANELIAHVTLLLEQPLDARILGHAATVADPVVNSSPDAKVAALSR